MVAASTTCTGSAGFDSLAGVLAIEGVVDGALAVVAVVAGAFVATAGVVVEGASRPLWFEGISSAVAAETFATEWRLWKSADAAPASTAMTPIAQSMIQADELEADEPDDVDGGGGGIVATDIDDEGDDETVHDAPRSVQVGWLERGGSWGNGSGSG